MLQESAELDRSFRLLTERQLALFEELRTAHRLLVEAPAGSGKTLICVKLVCDHVDKQRANEGGLAPPPVLLLVHSRILQQHELLPRVLQELRAAAGDDAVRQPE
ncbi:MAG: DEAD/DEAH box helicase family protein, partial [bacterium]